MNDDREFKKWMAKVDQAISRACGMGAEDLADICYRDMFNDGETHKAAARAAIEASGGDFE